MKSGVGRHQGTRLVQLNIHFLSQLAIFKSFYEALEIYLVTSWVDPGDIIYEGVDLTKEEADYAGDFY